MSNDAQVEDHYFSANPPPKALARHVAQASAFLDHQVVSNRPVVLITSGGTTVPLERNTVRFIDNFSAGTRGATSAEYFLEAGYGVISCIANSASNPTPVTNHTPWTASSTSLQESPDGSVVANSAHQEKMLAVLRKYNTARATNALLVIPFVTITDYLHELRAISRLMRPLGPRGLLYLAAAASDFFVPPERMAEHKIQSTTATDSLQPAATRQ
ncbi:phosphopantothenate-cysteine ligase [Verticillium dahliae VdLs.17]|uniref:Phosphopantothenate-cysteine ligase n=1 Tax=Verticillium dahliae (strain VdLs.17 / ATCC MYA-4575 / FGSC 10137) TaxID=498257 RepID=G2WW25_VERDV|nr:phosphopantothenate-cysteine ligase [Verticillium dahliae VdLs.17]EGY19795.1 phosphopantothenate-cysteine ligase [Verticillium dahliae VdLs.17]